MRLVLGVILVIVGIVFILAAMFSRSDLKDCLIGFLAPIPFGFANDRNRLAFRISLVMLFIYLSGGVR